MSVRFSVLGFRGSGTLNPKPFLGLGLHEFIVPCPKGPLVDFAEVKQRCPPRVLAAIASPFRALSAFRV